MRKGDAELLVGTWVVPDGFMRGMDGRHLLDVVVGVRDGEYVVDEAAKSIRWRDGDHPYSLSEDGGSLTIDLDGKGGTETWTRFSDTVEYFDGKIADVAAGKAFDGTAFIAVVNPRAWEEELRPACSNGSFALVPTSRARGTSWPPGR